jgi:hypothetical protein
MALAGSLERKPMVTEIIRKIKAPRAAAFERRDRGLQLQYGWRLPSIVKRGRNAISPA